MNHMNKKLWLSALFHTLFCVLLGIAGILTPQESSAAFILIGLYIVQPLAAMFSAVPFGFYTCGGVISSLYTVYTAAINQAVFLAVFGYMDAEALLITAALTVVGIGLGDYLKNKRNARLKNKNTK